MEGERPREPSKQCTGSAEHQLGMKQGGAGKNASATLL